MRPQHAPSGLLTRREYPDMSAIEHKRGVTILTQRCRVVTVGIPLEVARDGETVVPSRPVEGVEGTVPHCDRPSLRRFEIDPGAAKARNRERQPPSSNGWCAPLRREQRGLLARRRMPPFPAAQGELARLARLLLRQRKSVARLCPLPDVTHR